MNSEDVSSAADAHEGRGISLSTPAKKKRTAEELAAMILHDLSQIEGCPQRGLKVTVYGLNPWNAMLTLGVDSGPVPNKADLEALFDVITERLKRLYDVS